MGIVFSGILALLFLASLLAVFLSLPAAGLARFIRLALPSALVLVGIGLMLAGRATVGLGIAGAGAGWLLRQRGVGRANAPGGRRSTVRSAVFEMELDHDTGDIDGMVLTGAHEGRWLSTLAEAELMALQSVTADGDSLALLEAYLDRRMPAWREHAQPNGNPGQGSASGSGPMTKQEAYQVLGLEPGSGTQDIRDAHRRLMKRLHPDSGGSTFLAAKINEAKDVLLD